MSSIPTGNYVGFLLFLRATHAQATCLRYFIHFFQIIKNGLNMRGFSTRKTFTTLVAIPSLNLKSNLQICSKSPRQARKECGRSSTILLSRFPSSWFCSNMVRFQGQLMQICEKYSASFHH